MNWFKKETIECSGTSIEYQIQTLSAKYKTNVVLLNHSVIPEETYKLEIWCNLDSKCHLINIYIKCPEEAN